MTTTTEAARNTHCPQCQSGLNFHSMSHGSAWKIGWCPNCNTYPTFCEHCQIWYGTSEEAAKNDLFNCPKCNEVSINHVTCCMKV